MYAIRSYYAIPYKIITIGAGVFGVNFPIFLIASIVSRSSRFFLVAWLLKRYGNPVRGFIEKYSYNFV